MADVKVVRVFLDDDRVGMVTGEADFLHDIFVILGKAEDQRLDDLLRLISH